MNENILSICDELGITYDQFKEGETLMLECMDVIWNTQQTGLRDNDYLQLLYKSGLPHRQQVYIALKLGITCGMLTQRGAKPNISFLS